MTFDVTWQGNDHGTYSSPLTVTLPLREAVEFPVTVTPAGHGVHTAHLTLDHDDVAGYAHRMHAAIVAPEPLNAANEFTASNEVEVPRPGMKSLFFDVPEGVSALKIDVSWEDRPVTLGVFRPDTRGQRGEMIESGAGITQVVPSPVAGSARRGYHPIGARDQDVYEVEVLPGSTALMVRVGAVGDAAGVPGEGATYSYLDVVFNAAYGSVAVIDMPQERASGARWTTTAHGWAAMAAHARGREPYLGVVVEGRAGGGGYWVGVGEVR